METDFYERGWGECFHFAPRYLNETLFESIKRHEYYLAHRMRLENGMKVLDVGCGIGGPLRNIARFTGASIVGINNNKYQIGRVEALNSKIGLSQNCSATQADFMHIPFQDESFDAAYQIEATCHAPNRVDVYKNIYRILKPGALFGGYEWVMTDRYDPKNSEHVRIRRQVEMGSGIPELISVNCIVPALTEAGFEVLEIKDMSFEGDIPWYDPLAPKWTLSNWQMTYFGNKCITNIIATLETFHVLPAGTTDVQKFLIGAAHGLHAAGKLGIFTPACFHLARKPF